MAIFLEALKRFEMAIGVRPDIAVSNKSRQKKSLISSSPNKEEEIHIVLDWDIERERNDLASMCLEVIRLCVKNQFFEVNYKQY